MRIATKAEYLQVSATPNASKRIIPSTKSLFVEWRFLGTVIATKTEIYTRKGSNKIQSESFEINEEFLTPAQ